MIFVTAELLIRDVGHADRVLRVAKSYTFDTWLHSATKMVDTKRVKNIDDLVGQKVKVVVKSSVSQGEFDKLIGAMRWFDF